MVILEEARQQTPQSPSAELPSSSAWPLRYAKRRGWCQLGARWHQPLSRLSRTFRDDSRARWRP